MSKIATSASPPEAAPLSEVMLAMDVVDTLRHRQDLVERELEGEARETQLIEKLRYIYHQQGIEVSDAVLREGVKALSESRFVYTPPKPSLGRALARLYVSRKRWGPALLASVLVVGLGLGGYFLAWQPFQAAQAEAARVELTQTLPQELDALYETVFEETKVTKAATDADALRVRGKAAAKEGDRDGATRAIAELTALRDQLRQIYTVKIVNRPGQQTGFWRTPAINTAATNYYVVVEAIDPDGKALSLSKTSEETGKAETVTTWGQRVPEAVYRAVEADKKDDGIVERSALGVKAYGFLDVDWGDTPVMDGVVTKW